MSLILAGQMIVTDTSSGSERAGALGLLGISYGAKRLHVQLACMLFLSTNEKAGKK